MGDLLNWQLEADTDTGGSLLERFIGSAADTVESVANAYLEAWKYKQQQGLSTRKLEDELKNSIAMNKLAADMQSQQYALQLQAAQQSSMLNSAQLKQYALLAVVGFIVYKVFVK